MESSTSQKLEVSGPSRFTLRPLTYDLQLLFWLTPPLLAAALYGSAITLPFFWDDVANFQFMFGRPLTAMWVDSSGFPYYRPFTFSVWRLLQTVFGPTNSAAFHALNIGALIVNGWLVGLLAKQLAGAFDGSVGREETELIGWLAGALMTVFPFAALVVPLAASLFHLHVTIMAVSACVGLLEYKHSKRARWAAAAVASAALAPFAHESGLAAAGLMALCLIAAQMASASRLDFQKIRQEFRPAAVVGISLLLNIAFVPWWTYVPKARPEGSFAWVGWESVGQSATFFLEGLTFPFQFLARPLMAAGWADVWAVAALGAAALLIAWLALRDRRWLIFGVGFCFIAALPAMAALPFSYIIVSPRLMVFTAPAAAILWAAVAVESTRRIAHRNARFAAAAGLIAAAGIYPVRHILRETHLHHLALDHVWDFIRDAETNPGAELLLVNAMNWIAPVQASYALGHEGVEVMPAYLNPQLLAWAHTQKLFAVEGVTFPLVFPHLEKIYFSTWGEPLDWNAMADRVRRAGRVALVRYSDDQIEYLNVGRVTQASGQALASFEDRIWLTGAEAQAVGGAIDLSLDWRVNAASSEDIFANVLDCSGNVLGLSGGAGLGGIYPIWLWRPGESIHEARRVYLDRPSPDGCYTILIGLFHPADGARAAAYDANGQRLPDDTLSLQIFK